MRTIPGRAWKRLLAGALFAAAVWSPAPALHAQEKQEKADVELIAEFKRYFRKYKDTPTRVEAVLALQGNEDPEVVAVLVPLFDEAEPEVGLAASRVLSKFQTR